VYSYQVSHLSKEQSPKSGVLIQSISILVLSVYNKGGICLELHTVAYILPDHISPFDAAAGE
jgi:hypothetical protein